MKTLLMLASLVMVFSADAAPRHYRPHRPSAVSRISWKQIMAGGAAGGTVIAAYKVSNGVEDGIRTIAKEQPEEFAGALSVLTWPFRWAILLILMGGGYWLFRKFHRKEKEIHHGGSVEE